MEYKVNYNIGGDYHILDIFGGKGKMGMGIIYIVEHRDRGLPFILKTYQLNDDTSKNKFKREAETWISIGILPNKVEAYFIENIDFELFFDTEFISRDESGQNTLPQYLVQEDCHLRI